MGEVRNQFTFYRSYYEALLPLPRENQAAILLAVCAYALYETEPKDLTPVESAAFNLIRPTLDTARRKAQNGKIGGEAKGKQTGSKPKAKRKQAESKPEANRKQEREGERERGGDRERDREGILYSPISPFSEQDGPKVGENVWGEILDLYPSDHVGNPMEAEAAYKMRVITEEDARSMLTNLRLWKQSEQWNKSGGQYIPQLVNWISRGIWQTKPAKMVTPKGASGELGEAELEAIRKMFTDEEWAQMQRENRGVVNK